MTTRNELVLNKLKIQSTADVSGTISSTSKLLLDNNPSLLGGDFTLFQNPTNAMHAVTKQYVDAFTESLDLKASSRVATTGNITLSGTQTIDGIAVIAGDRVLVKDQTTGSENGIWVVSAGAWTRSTDTDGSPSNEVTSGMFTFIEEGTVNGNYGFVLITDGTIVVGTTALTFTQFSGAGAINAGNGLTQSGSTIDVVGTLNRIDVFANNVDIAATYAGQNTITTLGTIATGVWNGTTIAVANGGTGAVTLTGVLIGNGTGAFTAVPGTPDTIIKFISGGVADSSITDDGAIVTITADLTVSGGNLTTLTGNLDVSGLSTLVGDLDVGTNFYVTAASGSLAINSTMFTVDGANGNTVIAGTLGVTGLASVGSLDIGSLTGILIGTSGLVSAFTGTADSIVKFGAAGATLANSLITEIAGVVSIGSLFTVTEASGNLAINTTMFTVAGATGNTLIAGTLGLTGYATFTSGLTLNTNNDITTVGNVPTWLEYTKAFGDFDSNIDVALFTLPVGYVMHMIRTFVDTAFDNNRAISVGTTGNPSEYTSAINTTGTNQQLTTVNEVVNASTPVIAKSSGADSASGSIKFYVLVSRANL